VVLQGVLLALIVAAGVLCAPWPEAWRPWLWAAAVVVSAAALSLAVGGIRRLGDQLTPFPKPVGEGELQQHGVYRYVRHPIYGGVLLLCLAWALATSSVALAPAALLALLFEGKRHREEAWLVERYPGYEDYRRRVRRRFIPLVW
jgi:protein-S-isoprenylcysteine O-methyltransferase Ste14